MNSNWSVCVRRVFTRVLRSLQTPSWSANRALTREPDAAPQDAVRRIPCSTRFVESPHIQDRRGIDTALTFEDFRDSGFTSPRTPSLRARSSCVSTAPTAAVQTPPRSIGTGLQPERAPKTGLSPTGRTDPGPARYRDCSFV